MHNIEYKLYPSILDAFFYYESKKDDDPTDLLNQINKVKVTDPKKLAWFGKGIALNDIVDSMVGKMPSEDVIETDSLFMKEVNGFNHHFPKDLVLSIVKDLEFNKTQVWTEAVIGNVLYYGSLDYLRFDVVKDLKVTNKYVPGKFKNKLQQHVYPFCLEENGYKVSRFDYLITDGYSFKTTESYPYNRDQSILELSKITERFIHFINHYKSKITNNKIFAADMVYVEIDDNYQFPFGKNQGLAVGKFTPNQLSWWANLFEEKKYPNGFQKGFIDYAKNKL